MAATAAKVGRPVTPLVEAERQQFARVASLAGAVMCALRVPGRGRYSSERELRSFLKIDNVTVTTSDLPHALLLLESLGKIIRPEVPANVARPGRLASGSEIWHDMPPGEDAVRASELVEDLELSDADLDGETVTAAPVTSQGPDELAKAIIKAFYVPGRGCQGIRDLCESEHVLRKWLAADGVVWSEDDLPAALTRLETGALPGYDYRLVRGTALQRRQSWNSTWKMPPRAMLLEQLGPFNFNTYEPSDLEPYVIPPLSIGAVVEVEEGQSNAPVTRTVPT